MVSEQGKEAPADAEIDAHAGVLGIDPVHVVPLFVGDHFQGQFVVVAQENGPLAVFRNGGGLIEDVQNREAVLHVQRHEKPRHERKVKGHVAFIAVAEIGHGIFGPLVRFAQEHAVLELGVHVGPHFLQEPMRFREVFAVGPLALEEIRDGVQPQPVHAHSVPEIQRGEDRLAHTGIVVVEVGLMGIEPVPVVGAGHRVPCPVGRLEVLENDPGVRVALRGVAPDIPVPPGAAGFGAAGALEPGMLIGGVVDHQLGDHPQAAAVGLGQEFFEIPQGAVGRMDVAVVGDVVAVVAQRARAKGHQPDGGDPEVLQVVELSGQALEIADAVIVAVEKAFDVQLVNDGVFEPERVVAHPCNVPGDLDHGLSSYRK